METLADSWLAEGWQLQLRYDSGASSKAVSAHCLSQLSPVPVGEYITRIHVTIVMQITCYLPDSHQVSFVLVYLYQPATW